VPKISRDSTFKWSICTEYHLTMICLVTGTEGQWMWSHSDTELTDSHWGPNRPNTAAGNNEDCGVMVLQENTFWWEDTSCLDELVQNSTVAPICQYGDTVVTPTTGQPETTTTAAGCLSNWQLFEGHCYLYNMTKWMTWEEAEHFCLTFGSHLASVHSQAEQSFLNELVGIGGYGWLGGTDSQVEVRKDHFVI